MFISPINSLNEGKIDLLECPCNDKGPSGYPRSLPLKKKIATEENCDLIQAAGDELKNYLIRPVNPSITVQLEKKNKIKQKKKTS